MTAEKVAITIDRKLLQRLDRLVARRLFPSRSRAIQEAVAEKLERLEHGRLAQESAKLERKAEQRLAEEGLEGDVGEWPEY